MGKSPDRDQSSHVRESVTAANKEPLGTGRPFFSGGSRSSLGVKSLLKPSYLSGQAPPTSSSSSASSSTSSSVSAFQSFEIREKLASTVLPPSYSLSSGSSVSKFSKDYSALSAPQPYNSHNSNISNNNTSDNNSGFQLYAGFTTSSSSSSSSLSSTTPSASMILGSIKRDFSSSNNIYGHNNNSNNNSNSSNNGFQGTVNSYSNDDNEDQSAGAERKRKRRSRWQGSSDEKAVIPGMPTILPSALPEEQKEIYIAQLQIEEITRKLRTGDLGIPPTPENRSPSPEPIYGADGKRLNTREYRTRKKLEEERHKLIQRLLKLNPEYKPPGDYRQPVVKIVDRVSIPQEEHPEINFVGLLIGPRGNTLKGLEKDTGAKIIIRGKGSVKEGKVGGKAGHPLPGEDEPLHAYVTSNNPDSVKAACEKIKEIIRQGIDMPESQNHLRKNQLLELALLNGTLREGEGPKCSNCGSTSHRTWHCPDKPNVTNSVICTVCGGAGHIGKDCRMKRPGIGGPPAATTTFNYQEKAKIDEEYMSLMAELGEAPPNEPPTKIMRNNSRSMMNSSTNLFDKPLAPKAIAAAPAPPPTSATAAQEKGPYSAPIPPPPAVPVPPPMGTSYPPPPMPMMPPWGPGYPAYAPSWGPAPPPPPFWGSVAPPPSGPPPPPPPPPPSEPPPPLPQ